MSDRPIDEFLDLLPLTTEEQRTVKILLWFNRPVVFDEISKEYTKRYNIKIGSKMYHILNNLVKKKFAVKGVNKGKKNFCIHSGNLTRNIKRAMQDEMTRASKRYQKIEFLEKPSLTTHVGEKDVGELFVKIVEKLKQGCEIHVINDTLNYPIRSKGVNKKEFIKQENNLSKLLMKNRVSGKSKEYYIVERVKSERALKSLAKEFGKDYVKKSLKAIIKSLELDNFNIVFAKDLQFKFFVIPDYCAVTTWFSDSKKYSLDRAIAFWYPDDIKGLDDYFWTEWRRILNGRSEKEAKDEVKTWVEELMKKI